MANQLQLVIYEGYLGADPEVSFTQAGKAVSNFRIGSTRSYTIADGTKIDETTWLRVTAWGNLAEVVGNYCKKGTHVIVQGVLKVGETGGPVVYQRKDGGYGAQYELTAEKIRILTPKGTFVDTAAAEGGEPEW